MRILVTGGAGFIGSHVVDALVHRGHAVRILDFLHPAAHGTSPAYVHPAAQWLRVDVRDGDAIREALAGVDAVSHQAAMVGLGRELRDVAEYVSHNGLGTAVLMRELVATRFARRLVLASSMVVYGEGAYRCPEHGSVRAGPRTRADLQAGRFEPACPVCTAPLDPCAVTEDAPLDPRSVYAATKVHQEHLCAALARETDVTVTALRYHNVYGPRMPRDTPYAGIASIFRSALAAGRAPAVFEDGGQRRDFVHVRDVARANVLALERDAPGAFNIATGRAATVSEMAHALWSAAGNGTPPPTVTGQFRMGDVRHVFASPQRAREALGFTARVGLEEGMAEFAQAPLRQPSG